MQLIDKKLVPKKRNSTKYDLHYDGRTYPPKYVVSVANTFANGPELRGFKGGPQTNNFLIARGFPDIRNKQSGETIAIQAEDEDDAGMYAEGRVSYTLHRKLERNQTIARAVKNRRLSEAGDLCCDVCGFSFQKHYGPIGVGFIEAHHTIPISKLKKRRFTRLKEIALVCSNCHRMLHRCTPLLSIAELQKRLHKKKSLPRSAKR
jgi:hypothetical protein